MKWVLFSILIPATLFGQPKAASKKADLKNIYTRAIGDFIKAANKKNSTAFDTLYFLKRVNGEPDDFPDISLPTTIANTQVRLIPIDLDQKKQKQRPSRICINLIGEINNDNAEFIFVVFSNGFAHQYDYNINYTYDIELKEFKLHKVEFKPLSPTH